MNDEMLEFVKKVQSIAQIGMSFSKDPYAVENYEELKAASVALLEKYSDLTETDADLYREYSYPTPQPAVRTLVVEDGKILFVQEKGSGLWSLPGGWCDIDHTPVANAVKEVWEESGYVVECSRLLGVFDRRHYIKRSLYDVYCLYFLGNVVGGEPMPNHETTGVGWYSIDELPPLSRKNSLGEIMKAYEVYRDEKDTYYE